MQCKDLRMGDIWLKRVVLETARARKIDKERVTVVDLGLNERRSDGLSNGIVESVPDLTKVTNG